MRKVVFSDEDIKNVEWFQTLLNKSHFTKAQTVVDTYNRVFPHAHQKYTTCGSCVRRLMQELVDELNKLKKEAGE